MQSSPYKRILLKLSGEFMSSTGTFGVDPATVDQVSEQIIGALECKVDIAVVIGAGNIWRGINGLRRGMERATADYMGMLATVVNALAIQAVLESRDIATRVMSAIEMPPVAERYIRRRATRHLDKGRVVIFAAGTGNPFFTTDTAAALRASEIGAEVLIKATRVDGIYNSDPKTNAHAVRYDKLTYQEVLSQRLRVMDSTAISLCLETGLPVLVFDLTRQGNLLRVIQGEPIGTLVTEK